jgi:hypothetical protein
MHREPLNSAALMIGFPPAKMFMGPSIKFVWGADGPRGCGIPVVIPPAQRLHSQTRPVLGNRF